MTLFKFKGGIHPPENKELTEMLEIKDFCATKYIYLPMIQHIGSVLEPLVKVGDRVLKGQKIADSQGKMSVPIHSPVSGKIVGIEIMTFTLRGKVNTLIIENDFKEEWTEKTPILNYKNCSKEILLDKIREMGLVGLGGALFPTHIKLNPSPEKKIINLIVNAAECEPYLNSDNRLIIEKTKEILEGIEIILQILGIEEAVIGIEDNKKMAIIELESLIKDSKKIKLAVLKTRYPQGGEKQLIKAIYNKVVPEGKIPPDIGIIVVNITTAFWVYNAIAKGYPLIEEIVTVAGGAIKNPQNLRVPIGVQMKELLDFVGIEREKVDRLITGGPMMGISQYSEDVPVIKGCSGIIALSKEETNPYKAKSCISCGKCVDACPMGLSPLMYAKFAEFEKWNEFREYNIFDCIECGSCQYVCPSKRPLTEGIRIGKSKLRSMDIK